MNQDVSGSMIERIEGLARLRPTFHHDHPPVRNINQEIAKQLTVGQRLADLVASGMGSWRFIITQTVLLAIWIALNVLALVARWDPYPFILLNLVLSFQAAFAAPIIMMSQNRQALKDRLNAEHDYQINVKAEEEIKAILTHLEYQDDLILQILRGIERTGSPDGAVAHRDS